VTATQGVELGTRPRLAGDGGFATPVFLYGLCLFGPPNSGAGHCGLELVGDPGVQALAGKARGRVHLPVQLRRDSRHEVAGKGLVGFLAALGAERQIIPHGVPVGPFELGHACFEWPTCGRPAGGLGVRAGVGQAALLRDLVQDVLGDEAIGQSVGVRIDGTQRER
jgi:hypothetical protein